MAHITLYGASGSPFVTKVQLALGEKGLTYESVPTIPVDAVLPPESPVQGIGPELREHTPLRKIPFIHIGDHWLADSSVIVAYLERLYPQPALYPSDPWEYAQALWFEEYIDSGAYPKLFSTIFFERVLAPMLLGRPTDEAIVAKAIAEELPGVYGYLDRQIGRRNYLAGERFTVADIAAVAFFRTMQAAGVAPDDRWPNLRRYLEQMYGRPTIAHHIAQEGRAKQ